MGVLFKVHSLDILLLRWEEEPPEISRQVLQRPETILANAIKAPREHTDRRYEILRPLRQDLLPELGMVLTPLLPQCPLCESANDKEICSEIQAGVLQRDQESIQEFGEV